MKNQTYSKTYFTLKYGDTVGDKAYLNFGSLKEALKTAKSLKDRGFEIISTVKREYVEKESIEDLENIRKIIDSLTIR